MPRHHIYTKEQEDWIVEHAQDMNSQQLRVAFNETFGTNVSKDSILQKRQRMGIDVGYTRHTYSEEEKDFLRKCYGTMPTRDIHKAFCERFGIDVNYYTLKATMQRLGLKLDDRNKFSMHIAEQNKKPVGTEHKRSGYTIVKVSDEAGKHGGHKDRENWQLKQRVMWEKYHGEKVPEKHQICFLNGDKTDFSEENLICIPLRFMSTMSKNGWIKGNAEITKAGLAYCELYFLIQDKRSGKR